MIPLLRFHTHLQQIPEADWKHLFSLIAEIEKGVPLSSFKIEKNKDGSFQFPYSVFSESANSVLNQILKMELTPVFDYTDWAEGEMLLNIKETDFSSLNSVTLCQLLTVIVRTDRFMEGFLAEKFDDGTIGKILRGLEREFGG